MKLDFELFNKLLYGENPKSAISLASTYVHANNDYRSYHLLGKANSVCGNYEDGLKWFNHANALKPNAKAKYGSAYCLFYMKKYQEAYHLCSTIVPEVHIGYQLMASCLVQMGRIEESHKCINLALEIEPNNQEFISAKEKITSLLE